MPKRYTLNAIRYKDVFVVILAGGKGRRLRPLSTDSKPKAFLSVTADKKTMFRRAIERASGLASSGNIMVVANKGHASLIARDLPRLDKGNLILEPVSRNTAPAVALASSILEKRNRDAIVVVLPTDQYIIDEPSPCAQGLGESKYLAAIKRGIDFVRRVEKAIVMVGVKPAFPSTELGYIKIQDSDAHPVGAPTVHLRGVHPVICKVEKFIEKPDLNKAKIYIKNAQYLWNTGIFIFKAETMVNAVRLYAPEIAACLYNSNDIKKCYAGIPDISIDYAVIERIDSVYCVKGTFGWKDMGSFKSIKEVLKQESRRFIEKDGKVIKII